MLLAAQLKLRLLVNVRYDDLPQKAFLKMQGLGPRAGRQQAEHFGEWVHWFSSLTGSAFAPCYEEVLNPFRALRVNPSAGN